MIARNNEELQRPAPKVYPFLVFEIEKNATIPNNKRELLKMLKDKTAILFHARVCPVCHVVPKQKEWLEQDETEGKFEKKTQLLEYTID